MQSYFAVATACDPLYLSHCGDATRGSFATCSKRWQTSLLLGIIGNYPPTDEVMKSSGMSGNIVTCQIMVMNEQVLGDVNLVSSHSGRLVLLW